ncbi:helix-turn-helix domain-containing protein [Bacillus atrophaeus]|uniref:helix-turn-helix domain-containing protein n=1 Tax=Bacillus atrophaeus TaxID=1452 RepID=UPI0021591025|nr:helix-turn-helix transcriptional regulator [Bacillus atrophaeus]MEC0935463.1 helix-turn-helix transcriptional regulator [Bacillus atrophaeus]
MIKLTIGQRIAYLREKKGWSQRELARRLDIDKAVMNRIEKGTRPINDSEIIRLSQIFECSTDYLLKGESIEKKTDEILNDPKTLIAARDGEMTKEEARELLEYILSKGFDKK